MSVPAAGQMPDRTGYAPAYTLGAALLTIVAPLISLVIALALRSGETNRARPRRDGSADRSWQLPVRLRRRRLNGCASRQLDRTPAEPRH